MCRWWGLFVRLRRCNRRLKSMLASFTSKLDSWSRLRRTTITERTLRSIVGSSGWRPLKREIISRCRWVSWLGRRRPCRSACCRSLVRGILRCACLRIGARPGSCNVFTWLRRRTIYRIRLRLVLWRFTTSTTCYTVFLALHQFTRMWDLRWSWPTMMVCR